MFKLVGMYKCSSCNKKYHLNEYPHPPRNYRRGNNYPVNEIHDVNCSSFRNKSGLQCLNTNTCCNAFNAAKDWLRRNDFNHRVSFCRMCCYNEQRHHR